MGGIQNEINISELRRRNGNEHRIQYMSQIRNQVLAPLFQMKESPENIRILFINDIWFKVEDLLELISTNHFNYDIACAMDFYYSFYDTWVARDINGDRMASHYPFLLDLKSRELLQENSPVQVKSCWGGAVVMRTEPFLKWNVTFRASYLEDHCSASECLLICKDFWNLGFQHIFMNPLVKVAYSRYFYRFYKYVISTFDWFVYMAKTDWGDPQKWNLAKRIESTIPNIVRNGEEWCTKEQLEDTLQQIHCDKRILSLSPERVEQRNRTLTYLHALVQHEFISVNENSNICNPFGIFDMNARPDDRSYFFLQNPLRVATYPQIIRDYTIDIPKGGSNIYD